jgi:hypothetical protein
MDESYVGSGDDSSLGSHSSSGEMRMRPTAKSSRIKKSAGGGGISGDDMTEDEVAVMVKNALRKARRAMHNSSPLNTPSASSEEWSEPDFSAPTRKNNMDSVVDHPPVVETTARGTARSGGAVESPVDEDEDLAKRIEAEINSARAIAEQAYYGMAKIEAAKKEPLSPAGVASVKSDATEIHTNTTTSAAHKSPPTSPLRYRPLSIRRKAARKSSSSFTSGQQHVSSPPRNENTTNVAQDPELDISIPMNTNNATTASANLSPRYRKKTTHHPTSPSNTPRHENKEMDAQDLKIQTQAKDGTVDDASASYTSPDDAGKRTYKKEADTMSDERTKPKPSAPVVDTPRSANLSKSPKSSSAPTTSNPVLSSNSNILNSKVNTLTNSNLTKQQQRPSSGSRQVIFRHPYPLPPPPIEPRSDDIIINENTVPEKSFNVKVVEPDAELEQLIQQTQDEHNLVRRSNACGAIKVLASHDTNKAKLARTNGLLNALVYASLDDAVDSDALDARTRAVTALLYLSEPKDNRIVVAKHPGVIDVLVKVIEEDTGEARLRACSALATLAKTAQNRSAICNKENLATVLSNLLGQNVVAKKEEKEEPAIDEAATSKSESLDEGTTQDGRSLSNTYSGTFSQGTVGTETFTDDDTYRTNSYGMSQDERSVYSNDRSMYSEDASRGSHGGVSTNTNENESIGEEEGVEMQISSLKKLNIENASDFLERSQLSACATLMHLTKHCANAPLLCNNERVLDNILFLAGIFEHPLHTRCLEMLCNFTRFPSNNAKLASMPKVIETLTAGGKSKLPEDRLWSIRTIQNLCSDASSKVALATGSLLSLLSACAMRKDYEEQLAAVGALMNLATEPGSIVPLTNTKTVVATLVHLAHSPNTPASVRKIACDSLATIGLWLQTLASAGTVPEKIPFSPLPTHTATGWLRWD